MLNRLGCAFLAFGGLGIVIACGSPTLPGYSAPLDTSNGPGQSAPSPTCDANAPAPDAGMPWPCAVPFGSGVNVAWVRFANDVPAPPLSTLGAMFQNTYAAGGRVVRWWFHTNGTSTPGYDADGMALPISCSNIEDVKHILDTAHAAGVAVNISLWSFDMLKKLTPQLLTNNVNLLSLDPNRQAYINNVLTPLVTALQGYPGLYSYEIFNEPEGMASGGSWQPFTGQGGTSVDISLIQQTINWFADAIHTADPNARVTNGTLSFRSLSPTIGTNYYSDAALLLAGARPKGTLDFYEAHYYASDGLSASPFAYPMANWGLDKPTVIGEFYAQDQALLADGGLGAADTYTALHSGGYAGAWAWQYEHDDCDNGPQCATMWPAMQLPMQNLLAAAPQDLRCP
jgi:hypothetical protein